MIEIQYTTHPAISALDMHSKEWKAGSQGESCKSVFIVAVFMNESSQVGELSLYAHQQKWMHNQNLPMQKTATCWNIPESWGHCAKWKPVTKDWQSDSTCMKFIKTISSQPFGKEPLKIQRAKNWMVVFQGPERIKWRTLANGESSFISQKALKVIAENTAVHTPQWEYTGYH